MKKMMIATLFVFLLALGLTPFASAHDGMGDPIAGCPSDKWELMMVHEHEEHMHHHIGNDADQNGDGWLCMKMAANDNHVHIDNNVPFKP
jgi:hypothetical protein